MLAEKDQQKNQERERIIDDAIAFQSQQVAIEQELFFFYGRLTLVSPLGRRGGDPG